MNKTFYRSMIQTYFRIDIQDDTDWSIMRLALEHFITHATREDFNDAGFKNPDATEKNRKELQHLLNRIPSSSCETDYIVLDHGEVIEATQDIIVRRKSGFLPR